MGSCHVITLLNAQHLAIIAVSKSIVPKATEPSRHLFIFFGAVQDGQSVQGTASVISPNILSFPDIYGRELWTIFRAEFVRKPLVVALGDHWWALRGKGAAALAGQVMMHYLREHLKLLLTPRLELLASPRLWLLLKPEHRVSICFIGFHSGFAPPVLCASLRHFETNCGILLLGHGWEWTTVVHSVEDLQMIGVSVLLPPLCEVCGDFGIM
jgi:hypothetical protein